MRFLHLSDLHIGLKLYNQSLLEDQCFILDEITRIAAQRQPDAVVIAGDLYDRPVPSAEAAALFDHFVSELSRALPRGEIMMISGNHDSAQRLNLYREILSREHIHMIGLPPMERDEAMAEVTLTDAYGPVHFYLLPFVKPSMVRNLFPAADGGSGDVPQTLSYDETVRRLIAREISSGRLDPSARNVLVSHQFYLPAGERAEEVERAESEIVTVGNIDQVGADVLEPFDYAALGHIHRPMRVGSEFRRYSGTPLACSVSEAGQQKEILEVELGAKGNVAVQSIPLTPLRLVRVMQGTAEQVLSQPTDDYVRIVLTEKVPGAEAASTKAASPAPGAEEGSGAARAVDWTDLREQLRQHFPHLLEVRRAQSAAESGESSGEFSEDTELDPFDACQSFLAGRADGEELALLKQIINEMREEQDS